MVKIGITLGDPAGVGPEVALNALFNMERNFIPVIIGNSDLINKHYSPLLKEELLTADFTSELIPGKIYICDVKAGFPLPEPGKGSIETGIESKKYIDAALDLWKGKKIDAIVTGPVNKGFIEKSGTPFMGHTEYMAEAIGEPDPYMMMFSEKYRVLLVTTHYAVEELPELVTEDSICRTIRTGHEALKRIDGKNPQIAVCGFDPHCGDNGAISDFDTSITAKAVARCKGEGIDVSGPLSADTLFLPSKWIKYDLAIAHYHDQGLIPFKILAFESGVNVTLGLSLVRTSVDHGTAYDIAGKNMAGYTSMIEAIKLAVRLVG